MKAPRWMVFSAAAVAVAIALSCGKPAPPAVEDGGKAAPAAGEKPQTPPAAGEKPEAPAPQDAPPETGRKPEITPDKPKPITWDIGKPGGSLVFASISPPKTFNVVTASETSSTVVLGSIYEGLTTTEPSTTEVIPNIAKSWDVSEDGLTYTFHMRDDVRFNNGEPVTAQDVEFTFNELLYNKDVPAPMRDILTIDDKQIEVKALDRLTVQFVLPTKFAPFLRVVGTDILPSKQMKPLVDSGKFTESLGVNSRPEEIIGAGPFMLERYVPGQRVILKRNPHYWKKDEQGNRLPYLDRVVIEIVQTDDAPLLKFKQKETNYCSVRGEDYPLLKPLEKEGDFTIYMSGVSQGSQFLFFNQNTGSGKDGKPHVAPVKLKWFRNENFRKAVSHAIDRQSLIDILMNGLGVPQWSPESPASTFFYNSNVPQYPYDLAEAREILKAEGFADRDGDGFIEDAAGNVVEFSLTTNSENTIRIRMAEMIAKDLRNLGFKVNFLPLQFNLLVSRLDATFDWEAMILGLTGGIEPHFGKNVWNSDGHTHMWFPQQEKPSTDWEARIDELFSLGVKELDPQKRKAIYDEWQMIAADKLPFIYTVLPRQIEAVRNGIGNIHPTAYAGAVHSYERLYWKK